MNGEKEYEKWFFTAKDTKTDFPLATRLLYVVCNNDDDKFKEAESIMRTAFEAGRQSVKSETADVR